MNCYLKSFVRISSYFSIRESPVERIQVFSYSSRGESRNNGGGRDEVEEEIICYHAAALHLNHNSFS
ncbi:hypothetical protein SLEP1_g41154 [Rubroshorea leprosula]|uniref:Uncharacterized protein n=1 Tax=Rubroshorea leprosula TaxID=152421 RepID=A0AAV5L5P9_9ROSI|nr:hypothetical protein SLEP1_g41154 [Rubroshorea leprosula]